MCTQGPQLGAVASGKRSLRRHARDEVVDEHLDRSHDGLAARDVESEVEALRRPPPSREEDLDTLRHPALEPRSLIRTDEVDTRGMGKEHRRLREPAAERCAIDSRDGARPRMREHQTPEAHLEPAHPAGVAGRTYRGDHARDAD